MKRRPSTDGHTCTNALARLAQSTDADGEWTRERATAYSARVDAIHASCPICSRRIPEDLMPKKETEAAQ